jgi:predicted RNA methylase
MPVHRVKVAINPPFGAGADIKFVTPALALWAG